MLAPHALGVQPHRVARAALRQLERQHNERSLVSVDLHRDKLAAHTGDTDMILAPPHSAHTGKQMENHRRVDSWPDKIRTPRACWF